MHPGPAFGGNPEEAGAARIAADRRWPDYPAPVTRAPSPTRSSPWRMPARRPAPTRDWARGRPRSARRSRPPAGRSSDRGTDFALTPGDPARRRRGRAGPLRREPERPVAARGAADRPRHGRAARDGLARGPGARRSRARGRTRRPVRARGRGRRRAERGAGGRPRGIALGECARRRRAARPRSSGRASASATGRRSNIGLRRASGGPVVVLLDTSVEPTGDVVTPLARRARRRDGGGRRRRGGSSRATCASSAMRPPATSTRSRATSRPSAATTTATRGPLDERFRFYRNLDIWWSLVLRDEGEGEPPRRAVALAGLPARRAMSIAAGSSLPGRGARPPEQAQLLPDHRPVRVPPGPAGQPG